MSAPAKSTNGDDQKLPYYLSDVTVVRIYNLIHTMDIQLVQQCLVYMQLHADAILANGTIMDLDDEAFSKWMSGAGQMNYPFNVAILKKMVEWANAQCDQRGVTILDVLGQRLKTIRFDTMPLIDFLNCLRLLGEGFFTDEEVVLTIERIVLKGKKKAGSATKRTNTE